MAATHSLMTRFKSTLRQLDYSDSVSERDIYGIITHPKCAILVEWLCESISDENLLDEEEFRRFADLKERQQVLEGAALQHTLGEVCHACSDEDLSDEELRHTVASLEEQVSVLSASQHRLQTQHGTLSEQLHVCSRHLEQMRLLDENVAESGKSQITASHKQNRQFNIQLENVLQASSAVTASISSSPSDHQPSQDLSVTAPPVSSKTTKGRPSHPTCGLLSMQKISCVQSHEELFMRSLTEHTKKQFKGAASLGSSAEECHLVDTREADSLLLSGESSPSIAEACEELVRLRAIYITGQLQMHYAEAALAKVMAASTFVEKKLATDLPQTDGIPWSHVATHSSMMPALHLSATSTVTDVENTARAMSQLKTDISELGESHIPSILAELASLQDTHVLSGNYQLKLARQRYFLDKQLQLLDHLFQQRARHELLSMLLEIEERQHRRSDHLLTSLQSQLHDVCYKQLSSTLMVVGSPCLQKPDPDRSTIDCEDLTLTRLSAVLASSCTEADSTDNRCDEEQHQKQSILLTYQHIQEQTDQLTHALAAQLSKLSSLRESYGSLASSLESSVDACDETLALCGVRDDGLPTMRIQDLYKGMSELENLLAVLQQSVKDCLHHWNEKKKVVAGDDVEEQSRQLFSWFFTDPLKMELCIQHLRERVQS